MKELFQLFSRVDGLQLGGVLVEPKETARAIVQFSHGMSEHKERYLPLMEYLGEHGYVCMIHDHRGHGESVRTKEDLGYFYGGGSHALVEDLHQVTLFAKERWPGLPLILFGHSMGSLVARAYLKRYSGELTGLVVCGCPSYNSGAGAGRVLAAVLRSFRGGHARSELLNTLAFGAFHRKFPGERSKNNWVCSDQEMVALYDADPLCGFVFSLDAFGGLFELMREVYSPQDWEVQDPELPIWFISGSEDPCMLSLRRFVQALGTLQRVGYENVTYRLYQGMRHEILNEPQRQLVYEDLLQKLRQWENRGQ